MQLYIIKKNYYNMDCNKNKRYISYKVCVALRASFKFNYGMGRWFVVQSDGPFANVLFG